ncbi:GNAT family N-acetyltransferase [Gilvimarinus algae]|uniref:GNAT family N-acetyltransferase n=1 Tax=Gilvimarinus algae TaxID=3058037 RepID=A0ABT8T944_9GAMM|nr:GNAT family N-acetyltransferase [Gilvimarinus sp. SDUM040014]MDO3380645.1 GNAT family N-acetyltransferase [Gilvimarinus sp. SDUM040014]
MIKILSADYGNPQHSHDILALLDAYARDPMGGGKPLTDFARAHLVAGLANHGGISLLAYRNNQAIGLLNGFEGFSTFSGKPLINIHDLAVLREHRGQGVGQALLSAIEAIARERGCCKLTLEVLSGNAVAAGAYQKFGFRGYELDPSAGRAEFWEKKLL